MFLYLWLVFIFLIGVSIGSFLNVCVARMPMEKSLLWPGSRCGKCFQPIAWFDNLPLIGYLFLLGKCRTCGVRFSMRYFMVELLTGLGFLGLFYLEVVANIHDWPAGRDFDIRNGIYSIERWFGFGYHAILFSLLMAASFCDLEGRQIPLQLTLSGTLIGILGATLLPWPFPFTETEVLKDIHDHLANQKLLVSNQDLSSSWWLLRDDVNPRESLHPWPVWWPLPFDLQSGTWQTGLLTGIVGALVGTFLLRGISFLFSTGLGKEALGLGDADLMMMAGAFIGWQLVVVAFFVSVIPALFVGIFQMIVSKDSSMPFGPSLAMGVLITLLGWEWFGPRLKIIFFSYQIMLALIVLGGAFMLASSFMLRKKKKEPAK